MKKKRVKRILGFSAILFCLGMSVFGIDVHAKATVHTQEAVRTASFNSGNEWYMGNRTGGEWSGDDLLVSGSQSLEGWSTKAGDAFVDLDGQSLTMPEVTGGVFSTPRNAVVSFSIPEGKNPEHLRQAELSFAIRNLKSVSAGARLAVYGNSITETWNDKSGKTVFGASGTDAGLGKLELLGYTEAIEAGAAKDATVASGQRVTVKSQKLTKYIQETCQKGGYTELTFRIVGPSVGGIRIYSEYAKEKPTLKLLYSDGELQDLAVTVKTADSKGNILWKKTETAKEGSVYSYSQNPAPYIQGKDGAYYQYNAEKSQLSVYVEEGGANEIQLVYDKMGKLGKDVESYSGNMISEEGAWCWFADPRAIHYKNGSGIIDKTYIGYIDKHGAIKASQYDHAAKVWDEVLVRSNFQPDDHNNPTFLVLPDERVLIIYSRHTDEKAFYYRVSKEKGDITTLGEEKKIVTTHNTTYPSPFILSDDPEHFYLTWRGINWHPTIAKFTLPDENGDISCVFGPKQIVSSSVGGSTRPYAKYVSDGKSKIHITYTATHPDNVSPNPLYYSYVDITDMTLHDAAGKKLSDIGSGPFKINGKETDANFVVDDSSAGTRDWVWEIALEGDTPVIAMVRISPDKSSHDYYYAKWDGKSWRKTFLTNAGGKFHSSNTEYCYSGGMALDKQDLKNVYVSVPVEGIYGKVYEIFRYELNDARTEVVKKVAITANSRKNNVRPFLINTEDEDAGPKVLWMNGDYTYWLVKDTFPEGYSTSIMTNFLLPKAQETEVPQAKAAYDFDSVTEGNVPDQKGSQNGTLVGNAKALNGILQLNGKADGMEVKGFKLDDARNFTVSFYANIAESNYEKGHDFSLFSLGDGTLSLSVKDIPSTDSLVGPSGSTVQTPGRLPVLTGKGKDGTTEIKSTNLLSNSDWNKTNNGTNGRKNVTNMGWTHFAIVYNGNTGKVRLYVNGIVDANGTLEREMLSAAVQGGLRIGGFQGEMKDVRIFSDALGSTAVKRIMHDQELEVADMKLEGAKVSARFRNVKKGEAMLYVAVYDASGKMEELKAAEIGQESVEVELTSNLSGKEVKGFVWGHAQMKPLTEAWDIITASEPGGSETEEGSDLSGV